MFFFIYLSMDKMVDKRKHEGENKTLSLWLQIIVIGTEAKEVLVETVDSLKTIFG